MFLNYPNNPTGRSCRTGFFERVVEFARAYEILVVHDNAYSEIVLDGYRAPSFLATPGAKDVGVEVFSLSKGYNMTGWRCAAVVGNAEALETLLAAEDEHRLGHVRGGAAGGGRCAVARRGRGGRVDERAVPCAGAIWCATRCKEIGVRRASRRTARSTCGRPFPRALPAQRPTASTCSSRPPWCSRQAAIYGPAGEGWFRISLTTPDDRLLEAVERLGKLVGSDAGKPVCWVAASHAVGAGYRTCDVRRHRD